MKHTDYQKVFELATNILKDDKQMIQLTDELSNNLKSLEGSFLDDGIEEVKAFVKNLTARLVNAQGAFSAIASDLQAYGNLLKSGKG